MRKAFLALVVFIAFSAVVYADSSTLSVTSTPSGATVSNINTGQVYCQQTPCSVQVTVPPNSVNIKISLAGYYDWTYLVYLYANQTTNVSASLSAVPADPCANVTCNVQPISLCEDSYLRTYNSTGTCNNGVCSYSSSTALCPYGCYNSACVSQNACSNVTCNSPYPSYCSGTNLVTYTLPGTCNLGVCSYSWSMANCTGGCSNGACLNSTNSTGGGSGSGNTTGNSTGAPRDNQTCTDTDSGLNYYAQGTITDAAHLTPPTRTDYCLKDSPNDNALNYISGSPYTYLIEMYCNSTYNSGMSYIYNCTYGCTNGACLNQTADPCAGVTCNNPPAPHCTNGTMITRYFSPGICSGGVCSYVPYTNWTCSGGCSNGVCINQTNACGNATCNIPPLPSCNGNILNTYYPGSCNATTGSCDYPLVTTVCIYGCSNGYCNGAPSNGSGGGGGSSGGGGGGPRSAPACPQGCECRYDVYGNIASSYCQTEQSCNYNGVCDKGEGTDCRDCIGAECPVSKTCGDGSLVNCYRSESGCSCGTCPIPVRNLPLGCTQATENGFVRIICENRVICPPIQSGAKEKCINIGGKPSVIRGANSCDMFQCDLDGQDTASSIFAAPAGCPSPDDISMGLEKCRSLNLTGVMAFEGGCKIGKCIERSTGCKPLARESVEDCRNRGGNIITSVGENGCPSFTCARKESECEKDLPKDAYQKCGENGGQLVVRHDDDGCVSFASCLTRGEVSDSFVEDIKEVPSPTEMLSIALKLENLRLEFDKLAKKTNDIADYYKSAGSPEENRFRRVSDMFSSAKDKVDEIKTKIRDNLDSIDADKLLQIKQDVRYLKDVVIKDILYVMLSSGDDIEHIKSGTTKDCGTDNSCFDRAIRVCQPVTFMPDGTRGMLVELDGLEGDSCVMRASIPESSLSASGINPPYEMTCKIQKYTLGVSNPERDIFPYCTGNLLQVIKTGGAGSAVKQTAG